jgi:hypothetical protein
MEAKVILSYFLYIICFIFHTIGPTDLQLSPATQNVPGFSDIFSEVPKFHRHTKLCRKCRTRVYVFIKTKLNPGTISSTIKKNNVHPSCSHIELTWNNKLIYIVHLAGYFHSFSFTSHFGQRDVIP